ncbi:RNA polymerase sigma factor [Tautonia rosea]|uniref:RNA polymerase sigma factor n=1 Tax=Tautonia rosea TaxID=2728037 RepID=UPI0028F45F36|nr:sigma-70 family RNA polymerase sigma factor [Tautonia rosea]
MIALISQEQVLTNHWSSTAALVIRARDGDREAFGQLVEQYQRTVYAVALSRLGNASEAMELTQEVFLHVMGRLDQLREPERFAGWLRQVTVRMAINRATRRVPPASIEDEVLDGTAVHRHEPLDELITQERARRLWEALNQLKSLDREALVAFYIRELSLIEIAEELDVPIGTIKRRLHTARKRLKAQLRAAAVDPEEWTDHSDCVEAEESAPLLATC